MNTLLRAKNLDAPKKVGTTVSMKRSAVQLAKAAAAKQGISLSALIEKLVTEELETQDVADFPTEPAERPRETGFYWWRPDGLASWQVLEVRAEGEVLYVLCDDLSLYQCDDIAENPWYGEWHPVKIQPPAR